MMKKRIITCLLCIIISAFVIYKLDTISEYLAKYFYSTPTISKPEKNRFAKEIDYDFVQISEDFVPYNYQDLLNIFYTTLDSGYETFTFYCPSEYQDCISDVEKISNPENVEILTTIGNYVSPYNNFKSIDVLYDTAGEVTINITRLYSEQDILDITNEIDSIWKKIVTTDMKNEDIIYAFHDYVINNTRYDENYESELASYNAKLTNLESELKKHDKDSKKYKEIEAEYKKLKSSPATTHQASKANGPLFEGYAICSGYTDAMAILLDKLSIRNFKVASNTHVWNVVNINNTWKHIDLTWDDPLSVEDKSKNYLEHKFYMIDTKVLEQYDIKDHTFNKSIYTELK